MDIKAKEIYAVYNPVLGYHNSLLTPLTPSPLPPYPFSITPYPSPYILPDPYSFLVPALPPYSFLVDSMLAANFATSYHILKERITSSPLLFAKQDWRLKKEATLRAHVYSTFQEIVRKYSWNTDAVVRNFEFEKGLVMR